MPLPPGSRLGPYEIIAPVGAGGMGEVYQARDPRLGRDVAIKILPTDVAADPERLARFEREARLLAALNHPNIATLHGFESHERTRFLVMELVAGETLAERLARGPLAWEEALPILLQIAEGLEAAHESGIVHRDLKPANVKITPEGRVKILDFGLAKASAAAEAVMDGSKSPTLTGLATQRGEIMGTAAYMSPEQARGRPVDRRTDIWAFGCVAYEALAGARPFAGETVTDLLAAIVRSEPEWGGLPPALPRRLAELIRRCLEKDARSRLRDIGDARIELAALLAAKQGGASGTIPRHGEEEAVAARAPAEGPPRRIGAPLLAGLFLAGLAAGAALAALWLREGGTSPASLPRRLSIEAPPGHIAVTPRISADGRTVVFYASPEKDGLASDRRKLWIRSLDAWDARPIEGTERAAAFAFSPDGRWLGVTVPAAPGSTRLKLIKVRLDAEAPPLTLAEWKPGWADTFVWLPDGEIVTLGSGPDTLIRIRADGSGAREPILLDATLPDGLDGLHDVLPDGRILGAFDAWDGRGYHDSVVAVDPNTGAATILIEEGSSPHWSPSGHIVFTRRDTLLAAPFDGGAGKPGTPATVAGGLRLSGEGAGAWFDISDEGTMVWQGGGYAGGGRRVLTLDRDGTAAPWSEDRLALVRRPSVSPDGRMFATTVMSEDWLFSVWVSEIDRPRLRPLVARKYIDCDQPVWAPGSDLVALDCHGRTDEIGVWVASVRSASARRILKRETSADFIVPTSVSPDGKWLLLERRGSAPVVVQIIPFGETVAEIPESQARPLLPDGGSGRGGLFSPDGRWVAYLADASGRQELYVRPFGADGTAGPPTLVVSGSDVAEPAWAGRARDGAPILAWMSSRRRMEAVEVRGGPYAALSEPRVLRELPELEPPLLGFDFLPDGRLLAVQREASEAGGRRIDLVLDGAAELARLAGPGR